MSLLNKESVWLEDIIYLITDTLSKGKTVKFMPKGNSMLPMLRQDIDSVEISPIREELKKYDLIFYKRDNGSYILHRIIRVVGNEYICAGDNQLITEKGVRNDQILAIVTAYYRKDKRHETNEPVYQIYCRIWFYLRKLIVFGYRVRNKIIKIIKKRGNM